MLQSTLISIKVEGCCIRRHDRTSVKSLSICRYKILRLGSLDMGAELDICKNKIKIHIKETFVKYMK